jgi:hypothetical protein
VYRTYEAAYSRLKWLNTKKLLVETLRNPLRIPIVLGKLRNLFRWLLLRLRGKRIRW